ncbi:F-type H+-transporting ATPase subunit epsilon [Oscillospiraceae bacterium]|nr:F-type H+-transporting ATPase subunit epsilon [Oscillospiraceae bacterium]
MADAVHNKVRLTVVTPYKNFIDEDVTSIILPSLDGEIGVMAGHTPLVLALRPGIVTVRTDDEIRHFTVSEGYTEVGTDLVLVICNAAEWPDDVHVRWIKESKDEALKLKEDVLKIEDNEARKYAMTEVDEKLLRVKARTHLISLYGNEHQKQRLEEFELI